MEELLQEIRREVSKCVRCGFCRSYCPVLNVLGWDSFGPRGRVVIIREIVEGELELEQALVSIFSCAMCAHCDEICPSSIRISELVRKIRVLCAQKFG